ncbi:voltage-gated chloride channel family protein [Chitinophagaceae bacterium LB-8]|uniref:Voltage-gated chloride channel family protein n=1 Tax=Paraflavisolibacter caeni TaxID=2982496 RepID=A0A9X3BJ50_9BACT|nr:voltage-gated chloride channel family protein [Paraflavisolibacter caeni]MCU7552322.1 voltage-gated chloride channel family protein [Paraflavisolibacter caeni]
MKQFRNSFEQIKIAQHLLYWTVLIVPVSIVIGSLVSLFLWLLDMASEARWNHLWLIYFLPLAGLFITYLYKTWGKNSDIGNNLILDEIHKPGGGIPARMTPLVLISTLVTHLFGGSAGREGTAVQMGGSISALFSRWYQLKHNDKRILLMCGMAAGFGAVFGTPIAGAIFALEVLSAGRIKYDALLPCFIASLLADFTCAAYGIQHTRYIIAFSGVIEPTKHWISFLTFDYLLLFKVVVGGIAFGLAGFLFSETSHFIKDSSGKYIQNKWLIPVAGGIVILAISHLLGTFDYLGLGVTNPKGGVSIVSAFSEGGATSWSWFWKLLLTAITLGTGFKGGEVTPLFFIGATLGNVLATVAGAPVDLFAGLGFIAVFAGATNTPIACTLMGVELFGSHNIMYYAVACFTAYYFSGHSGIYGSQRIAVSKFHHSLDQEDTIGDRKRRGRIEE